MKKPVRTYLVSILLALLVGGLSALLTRGGVGLYETIVRPPLSPPSWVFGAVWTVLFILMGVSSADVYLKKERHPDTAATALAVYALSLAVNFSWSIFFFNGRLFFFSFLWLLLLLATVILTILLYRRISPIAAYLQIPYALWVGFAGYLTLAIAILNK